MEDNSREVRGNSLPEIPLRVRLNIHVSAPRRNLKIDRRKYSVLVAWTSSSLATIMTALLIPSAPSVLVDPRIITNSRSSQISTFSKNFRLRRLLRSAISFGPITSPTNLASSSSIVILISQMEQSCSPNPSILECSFLKSPPSKTLT